MPITSPPRRPPEDLLHWVSLGVAQAAIVTLVLLRRRGVQ